MSDIRFNRWLHQSGTGGVYQNGSGRVGIGSSAPTEILDVVGNATFSGNVSIGGILTYDDVTNIDSVGVITARSGIHVTGGRVGIGTDNPQEDLHVYKASSSTAIKVETTGSTAGASLQLKGGSGRLDFGVPGGSGNRGRILYANAANTVTGAAGDRMEFFTNNDTSNSAILITSDNHVGINSSIPGSLVDIMGQTSEDAIVNIRSYDKSSAIKLWPSNDHDLDRWRMAFWENNAVTDGNHYPDWSVDGYGRQFMNNNLYIGRSRSFNNAPSNRYHHYGNTGPGVIIQNGVDGDDTNYCAYLKLVCYQNDTDDRKIMYYTDSTDLTAAVDYDQDQKFAVSGNGRVQGLYTFWSGRVESDESSPNSVYTGGTGNGFFAYHSSGYSAYMRSRSTDNSDVCYYLDTGGGPVFKIVSNGNGYFDGSADAGNADYAEYFEWADGNPNNEDRRGYPVIIVPNTNGKIGIATTGDDHSQIMGIVSANPGFVGDTASLNWQGRHLKDEWGSWVTEDQEFLVWNKKGTYTNENGEKVENPQPNINDPNCDPEHSVLVSEIATTPDIPQYALDNNLRITRPARVTNPDFDPSQTYTSRSDRQEWTPVGLMGKLWLRANQPTGDRWIKLKDGNNGLSYWLVR